MAASYFNSTISTGVCSATALPYPTVFGAQILSLETTLVTNYSQNVGIGAYTNHGGINVTNTSFCNVTISYTHPGQNDTIAVQVWLPINTWNGRLQAIGSGWQPGLSFAQFPGMTASVGEGYSTVGTDGGLGSASDPADWGLLSPGNVDLYALNNLASRSLNDLSIIGKSITASFYSQPAKYSYWSGCSQGGRQGMMLAQRYPNAFDGIAVSSPAIYWNTLFATMQWPALAMDLTGEYVPSCEFNAITAAAIKECDSIDGVVDGIISLPQECHFDAMSVVGTSFNCPNFGTMKQISSVAANEIVRLCICCLQGLLCYICQRHFHTASMNSSLEVTYWKCNPLQFGV